MERFKKELRKELLAVKKIKERKEWKYNLEITVINIKMHKNTFLKKQYWNVERIVETGW